MASDTQRRDKVLLSTIDRPSVVFQGHKVPSLPAVIVRRRRHESDAKQSADASPQGLLKLANFELIVKNVWKRSVKVEGRMSWTV